MWWAYAKNYVASSPQRHTGMKDLKRLMREGLYGFTGTKIWKHPKRKRCRRLLVHAPVDAAFAAKLTRHVHENLNKWLARGDLSVKGTIDHIDTSDWHSSSFIVTFSEDSDSDSDSEDDDVLVESVEGREERRLKDGPEEGGEENEGEEKEEEDSEGAEDEGKAQAEGVETKAEKLYCVCRKDQYGPSGDCVQMIECCLCKEWFHDECVGFVNVVHTFVCAVCPASRRNPSRKKKQKGEPPTRSSPRKKSRSGGAAR